MNWTMISLVNGPEGQGPFFGGWWLALSKPFNSHDDHENLIEIHQTFELDCHHDGGYPWASHVYPILHRKNAISIPVVYVSLRLFNWYCLTSIISIFLPLKRTLTLASSHNAQIRKNPPFLLRFGLIPIPPQGGPGGRPEPRLRPPRRRVRRGRVRSAGTRAEHLAAERHTESGPGGAGGGATHAALRHGTATWRNGISWFNIGLIWFNMV